jgi:hypothetical protein
MLTDVSSRVLSLQEAGYELFLSNSLGLAKADPEKILPGVGVEAAGWHVLDASKKDGLNVDLVKYSDIKLDKNREVGELFAAERGSGATRLFFVWVPRPVAHAILAGNALLTLHFHLLFHPPTWETCYKRTPYWQGTCLDWRPVVDAERDVCVADMDKKPLYVRLGLRYVSQYSRAIPQHLIALRGREPLMVFVAPVSDSRDFVDIVATSSLLALFRDTANFITSMITKGKQTEFAGAIGKVIVSGYSRSGTRLTAIMSQMSSSDLFFRSICHK